MPPLLVGRYLAPFVGQEGVTHLLVLARAVRPTDLQDLDLNQVRAHTLVVRGEKDAWVDPEVARKLGADIADCRIVAFPEAARLIPEESPDELATLIASFVSPHVGRTADEVQVTIGDDEPMGEEPIAKNAGTPDDGTA